MGIPIHILFLYRINLPSPLIHRFQFIVCKEFQIRFIKNKTRINKPLKNVPQVTRIKNVHQLQNPTLHQFRGRRVPSSFVSKI